KDFEVIIVDDCSTDDSFESIKALVKNDHRIKLYQNQENQGVGFTKRKCVELSTGEICGFLDPDDALAENALEISIKKHNDHNIAT
ncbi:glycosyltransferase family 2 protein, partial [Salmonella enterica subsp. enterica serovar Derby]|nr:glycosyltransferase family 2 protein [Salmonella enterica subsp. enterica serovar Derby]